MVLVCVTTRNIFIVFFFCLLCVSSRSCRKKKKKRKEKIVLLIINWLIWCLSRPPARPVRNEGTNTQKVINRRRRRVYVSSFLKEEMCRGTFLFIDDVAVWSPPWCSMINLEFFFPKCRSYWTRTVHTHTLLCRIFVYSLIGGREERKNRRNRLAVDSVNPSRNILSLSRDRLNKQQKKKILTSSSSLSFCRLMNGWHERPWSGYRLGKQPRPAAAADLFWRQETRHTWPVVVVVVCRPSLGFTTEKTSRPFGRAAFERRRPHTARGGADAIFWATDLMSKQHLGLRSSVHFFLSCKRWLS